MSSFTTPTSLVALGAWGILFANGLRAEPTADTILYSLSFPRPHTHYVEVECNFPTAGESEIELVMAAWTPGSYLIREYAKHVEGLQARTNSGSKLRVEKSSKNRWRVRTEASPTVTVFYRVYCHEMSVRANWVDRDFAVLNGASTFITLANSPAQRHEVFLKLPKGWSRSFTGLDAASTRPHHFVAEDFDTLVDAPILLGNPSVHEFDVQNISHLLIHQGDRDLWDEQKSAYDVERVVIEQRRFWGVLPYDRYLFLNVISEARGGLEHSNSTLMMTNRWQMRTRKDYVSWLSLVSHEFFHTWNVKRLRPHALGPFDYDHEAYTTSLWVAEGVTTYYADLLLSRAGLITPKEYLGRLSDRIKRLQAKPGRFVQPLSEASFDAWIKFYRPDENSANTSVSYYTKGAVVSFLLDVEIRKSTQTQKSLDDVMRTAYERYSQSTGFTESQFRAIATEVAGTDLSNWFTQNVDRSRELDYEPALEWFGLRFASEKKRKPKSPKPRDNTSPGAEKPKPGWLGLVTKDVGGRLVVTRVVRNTPGYESGFNVDDEIVAIDGIRVVPSKWKHRLERYPPETEGRFLIARRDKLIELEARFGRAPEKKWRLEVDSDGSNRQATRRREWLGTPRRF